MTVRATITYRRSPEHTLRELRQAVKSGLKRLVEQWHQRALPEHFEPIARRRYGYQRRTQRYQKRKLRVKHHDNPLVWSGTLRDTATRRAAVTGSSKQARVRIRVPYYVRARSRSGCGPNLEAELTATTRKEVKGMARDLHRYVTRALNKMPTRTKIVRV